MATREALLAEYDHELAATRRLLEQVPSDRLAWRPHERSRSLGALAAHLAEIPGWTRHIVDETRFDLDAAAPSGPDPDSREAILQHFDREVARTRKILDRSDAELNALWSLRRAGREVFCMPRVAAVRTLVLGHIVHHRGQLSVYLRLNEIPVPALYGPTADTASSF